MNIDNVIMHMRQQTFPTFQGRIFGAAELAAVWDNGLADTPSAYIFPVADRVSGDDVMNGLRQTVTETIGIAVCLDNSATDRRAQVTANRHVSEIRGVLWRALLNWKMDSSRQAKGFRYGGGDIGKYDPGRLWWEFTFSQDITIGPDDGYKPEYQDLNSAEFQVFLKNSSDPERNLASLIVPLKS